MDITAEDLLSEIHHETMQDLLLSVRHGEAEVDRLLQNDEDNSGDTNHDGNEHATKRLLARGNIVELQGSAGTGKTQLLYQAVTLCILPLRHSDIELGGWGQAAFILDTDYTFDVHRLKRILLATIDRVLFVLEDEGLSVEPGHIRNEVLQEALRNLHIFYPTSSAQLAATILSLPQYHHEEPHIQHRELGLLVVDSMSSFYWQDRFTTEQLRSGQSFPVRTPFRNVILAIERLHASHRPTILLTNWGLNSVQSPSVGTFPFFRQHLYPMPPGFIQDHHENTANTASSTSRLPVEEESRNTAPSHIAPESEAVEPRPRHVSTLSLTHHITVVRLDNSPPIEGVSKDDDSLREPDVEIEASPFLGFVRTRNNQTVAQLRFSVHDNHIDIQPGDMFKR